MAALFASVVRSLCNRTSSQCFHQAYIAIAPVKEEFMRIIWSHVIFNMNLHLLNHCFKIYSPALSHR